MAAQLVPAAPATLALQDLLASVNATCPATFGDAGGCLGGSAGCARHALPGLAAQLHSLG